MNNQAARRSTSMLKVTRVTMPRYEVEFRDLDDALATARQIRDKRAFMLAHGFAEARGSQMVLDLSVQGHAFSVALLFRVIMRDDNHTAVEWWARRQTDPALLDLWIDALESRKPERANDAPRGPTVPEDEVKALFELCRRALSKNPFVVLGVHWSSSPQELREASHALTVSLKRYSALKGLSPRMRRLLDQAMENVPLTLAPLLTVEGRRAMRSRYVPANQRQHARTLLGSKLEVARMRGNMEEAAELMRAMAEL